MKNKLTIFLTLLLLLSSVFSSLLYPRAAFAAACTFTDLLVTRNEDGTFQLTGQINRDGLGGGNYSLMIQPFGDLLSRTLGSSFKKSTAPLPINEEIGPGLFKVSLTGRRAEIKVVEFIADTEIMQCTAGVFFSEDIQPGDSGIKGWTFGIEAIFGTCGDGIVDSALGCVPFDAPLSFAKFFLGWAIGIASGVSFLMILFAGFKISTSAGDPKKLEGGKEILVAAITALLMMIFSVFILRVIGVNVLEIFL